MSVLKHAFFATASMYLSLAAGTACAAPVPVTFDVAGSSATYNQTAFHINSALDGVHSSYGWAVAAHPDETAVFATDQNLGAWTKRRFTIDLTQNYGGHQIGYFSLSYTEEAGTLDPLSSSYTPFEIISVTASSGRGFSFSGNSILAASNGSDIWTGTDTYTVVVETEMLTSGLTGFQMHLQHHPSLAGTGPGYGSQGNIVLSEFVATMSDPLAHAEVPPTADAGSALVLDASNASASANGTGSNDPNGSNGNLSYSWTVDGHEVATTATPSLSLADLGFARTTDTKTISLTVTDDDGLSSTNSAQTTASYDNASTTVLGTSATLDAQDGLILDAEISDADLAFNSLAAGFERIQWSFSYKGATLLSGWLDDAETRTSLHVGSTLDFATWQAIMPAGGLRDIVFSVQDQASANPAEAIISADLSHVPEPAATALLLGLGIAATATRRRKSN